MGLFPWSQGNTTKALDIIENAGDKLWHTEEEKADGRQKRQETYIKLMEVVARQCTVMAQTRRMFALSTLYVFLANSLAGSVCIVLDKPEMAAAFYEQAAQLFWLVAAFAAFYVGPDAVQSGADMARNFKTKRA